MFNYEKRLQYPVNITRCDPKAAMVIMSQYGGLYSRTYDILKCIILSFIVLYHILLYLCILKSAFTYDIMSSDKEKLLFRSEHKTKSPMLPTSGIFIPI